MNEERPSFITAVAVNVTIVRILAPSSWLARDDVYFMSSSNLYALPVICNAIVEDVSCNDIRSWVASSDV